MTSSSPPPPQHMRFSAPLLKQNTWSSSSEYSHRDKAWLRRKDSFRRRTKSLTEDDIEELRACIELGLGFEVERADEVVDERLSMTLPALEFYYKVNRRYNEVVMGSSVAAEDVSPEVASPSSSCSSLTMFSPGDDPETVKTRLRRWAQVVACSVRLTKSGLRTCRRP
ncbi:hypothetical protein Droror1_Dr00009121 [Drosera rotundifolia]